MKYVRSKQRNTRTSLCFSPFSIVFIVDLEKVNVSLIVLVYVDKIFWQSILFQETGNGAVIKHVRVQLGKNLLIFFIGVFRIREGARRRRIRIL